jgi:hypothetical protein
VNGYGAGVEVSVRVPVGSRIFVSSYRPDRISGTSSIYPMGTLGSFPGSKATEAWSRLLTNQWRSQENMDLYLHSTIHLLDIVLSQLSTRTILPYLLYILSIIATSPLKAVSSKQMIYKSDPKWNRVLRKESSVKYNKNRGVLMKKALWSLLGNYHGTRRQNKLSHPGIWIGDVMRADHIFYSLWLS